MPSSFGADSIEHGSFIDEIPDATIAEMKSERDRLRSDSERGGRLHAFARRRYDRCSNVR